MRVDLHTHTDASDGELSPQELLAMQGEEGTVLVAITDHDTLAGYDRALGLPGPRLLSGIEFSVRHGSREIHMVGLGFDAADTSLRAAVAAQSGRREARAAAIATKLESLGHRGALEAVRCYAGEGVIGRPHFARFLVETGRVRDAKQAFDRYLGEGKPAWCAIEWPALAEVVGWIRAAGGLAVLAHPLAYSLGRGKLRELLAAFRDSGGAAVEVALAGLPPAEMQALARLVRDLELRASAGSDFHSRAQFWRRPSRIPPLPEFLEPVWAEWC